MAGSVEHQAAGPSRSLDIPTLYVDLDGTVLKTDLLYESLLALLRSRPLRALRIPLWLLRGRAFLKARLADDCAIDAARLPYREPVVEFLRTQAGRGRRLVLATASDERLARAVAQHLGLFAAVLASNETRNLKAARKAEAIRADAAGQPFAYAGNDRADLPVWAVAAAAVLVDTPARVRQAASQLTRIEQEFSRPGRTLGSYLRAMRIHQWAKNGLVFIPLLTAQMWGDSAAWMRLLTTCLAFSLGASAIYVVNDLLDLPADRRHPRKRARPFAAADVPILHGLLMVPVLLAAAIIIAASVNTPVLGVLLVYLCITIAYSLWLKRIVLIDVMALGALYTIRVLAGAAALPVMPTFWLLAFSMTVFLSLALIKRCSELESLAGTPRSLSEGRDYRVADRGILQAIGVSSGFAAVLVLALFVNSEHVAATYPRPQILWLLCGTVTYWIARMWLKTARGEMHDDPLIYAARDRASLVMLALSIVIVLAAAL